MGAVPLGRICCVHYEARGGCAGLWHGVNTLRAVQEVNCCGDASYLDECSPVPAALRCVLGCSSTNHQLRHMGSVDRSFAYQIHYSLSSECFQRQ